MAITKAIKTLAVNATLQELYPGAKHADGIVRTKVVTSNYSGPRHVVSQANDAEEALAAVASGVHIDLCLRTW